MADKSLEELFGKPAPQKPAKSQTPLEKMLADDRRRKEAARRGDLGGAIGAPKAPAKPKQGPARNRREAEGLGQTPRAIPAGRPRQPEQIDLSGGSKQKSFTRDEAAKSLGIGSLTPAQQRTTWSFLWTRSRIASEGPEVGQAGMDRRVSPTESKARAEQGRVSESDLADMRARIARGDFASMEREVKQYRESRAQGSAMKRVGESESLSDLLAVTNEANRLGLSAVNFRGETIALTDAMRTLSRAGLSPQSLAVRPATEEEKAITQAEQAGPLVTGGSGTRGFEDRRAKAKATAAQNVQDGSMFLGRAAMGAVNPRFESDLQRALVMQGEKDRGRPLTSEELREVTAMTKRVSGTAGDMALIMFGATVPRNLSVVSDLVTQLGPSVARFVGVGADSNADPTQLAVAFGDMAANMILTDTGLDMIGRAYNSLKRKNPEVAARVAPVVEEVTAAVRSGEMTPEVARKTINDRLGKMTPRAMSNPRPLGRADGSSMPAEQAPAAQVVDEPIEAVQEIPAPKAPESPAIPEPAATLPSAPGSPQTLAPANPGQGTVAMGASSPRRLSQTAAEGPGTAPVVEGRNAGYRQIRERLNLAEVKGYRFTNRELLDEVLESGLVDQAESLADAYSKASPALRRGMNNSVQHQVAIQAKAVDLILEKDELSARLLGETDPLKVQDLKFQIQGLESRIGTLTDAGIKMGSEWGRAGQARQMTMEPMSRDTIRVGIIKKLGRPLSQSDEKVFEKLFADFDAAKTAETEVLMREATAKIEQLTKRLEGLESQVRAGATGQASSRAGGRRIVTAEAYSKVKADYEAAKARRAAARGVGSDKRRGAVSITGQDFADLYTIVKFHVVDGVRKAEDLFVMARADFGADVSDEDLLAVSRQVADDLKKPRKTPSSATMGKLRDELADMAGEGPTAQREARQLDQAKARELKQAEAAEARAKASYEKAQARFEEARARAGANEAKRAKAAEESAQRNYDRMKANADRKRAQMKADEEARARIKLNQADTDYILSLVDEIDALKAKPMRNAAEAQELAERAQRVMNQINAGKGFGGDVFSRGDAAIELPGLRAARGRVQRISNDILKEADRIKTLEEYRAKDWMGKIGSNTGKLASNLRQLLSGFYDAGFTLRQGFLGLMVDPKSWANSTKNAFRSFPMERPYERVLDDLMGNPFYDRGLNAGLELSANSKFNEDLVLSDSENKFLKWITKGDFSPYGSASRAYLAAADTMRVSMFENVVKGMEKNGVPLSTESEAAIADIINVLTGRGVWGKNIDPTFATALNQTIFATRYYTSRIEFLTGMPLLRAAKVASETGDTRPLQFAARAYGQIAAGFAAIAALGVLGQEQGLWKFSTDPRDTNFLQLRIRSQNGGEMSYDFTGGNRPFAVLLWRLGQSLGKSVVEPTINRSTGAVNDPTRAVVFKKPIVNAKGEETSNTGEALGSFITTRTTPAVRTALTLFAGQTNTKLPSGDMTDTEREKALKEYGYYRTFGENRSNFEVAVLSNILPISAQQALSNTRQGATRPEVAAALLAEFLGAGTNFSPKDLVDARNLAARARKMGVTPAALRRAEKQAAERASSAGTAQPLSAR